MIAHCCVQGEPPFRESFEGARRKPKGVSGIRETVAVVWPHLMYVSKAFRHGWTRKRVFEAFWTRTRVQLVEILDEEHGYKFPNTFGAGFALRYADALTYVESDDFRIQREVSKYLCHISASRVFRPERPNFNRWAFRLDFVTNWHGRKTKDYWDNPLEWVEPEVCNVRTGDRTEQERSEVHAWLDPILDEFKREMDLSNTYPRSFFG